MKTIIKVLVMTILMTAAMSASATGFISGKDKAIACTTDDATFSYYRAVKRMNFTEMNNIAGSKLCTGVDKTAKFEIIQYNDAIAQVAFYNAQGQLMQDRPMWILMLNVDPRTFKSAADDLNSQIKGTANQKSNVAPEPILNAPVAERPNWQDTQSADMDAFLKSAIAPDIKQQAVENEGD